MYNPRRYHVAAGTFHIDTSKEMVLQAFLGTCVGLAIYDDAKGIGGIIHLLLPEPVSIGSAIPPEKYASTGVPLFIQAMKEAGATPKHMHASIAGGALVGPVSRQDLDLDIGGRTAETVKAVLEAEGIAVEISETGGFFTCCLSLNTQNGKSTIEPAGQAKLTAVPAATVPTPKQIVTTIERLKPIPQVALKVMRIIGEGIYDIDQIAAEVRQDQVISAKTLQICNSALFAKSKKFESLDHALVFLGQHQFVKLVLSEAVQGYFSQSENGYSLCKGGMYHHAVGTATIAEKIAQLTQKINATTAYTAGLLHDIGKVVLDQWINTAYPLFYRKIREENASILRIENKILGTNHTLVGGLLAERWSFSDALIDVVKYHHNPDKKCANADLNLIVYLADLLMTQFNSGLELERMNSETLAQRLEAIGLSPERFPDLVDQIPLKVLEIPSPQPTTST